MDMGLIFLAEIEFIQGEAHKTLTDSILIDNFLNIRKDLLMLKIACWIVEILDNLVVKEELDERIWELVKEVFKKLNSLEIKNPALTGGAGRG